jgi:hypothetical protein
MPSTIHTSIVVKTHSTTIMNRIGLRTIARSSYRPVQITYRTVRHNSTAPPSIPSKSKFAKYIPHLDSISTKSGLPLPSLALSFAILHELTAIVPLVGIFFLFQALGIGGSILQWASHQEDTDEFGLGAYVKSWLAEGQKRVDKVARRYGLFGYDKMSKETEEEKIIASPEHALETAAAAKQSRAAAGVANAVAAYIVVKVVVVMYTHNTVDDTDPPVS